MADSLFDIARKIFEGATGLASDVGAKLADAGIAVGGQEGEAPQQQYAPAAVQQPDASSYDVSTQQQPEQPSVVAETDSEEGGEGQSDDDSPSELRVLAPLVRTMNDILEGAGLHRDPYQGSTEQLRSLEEKFQEDQDKRLAQAQSAAENQLYANYAMMGFNPYDDPTFQENLAAVKTMDKVPSTYADAMRRFADEEGNFKFNPLDWNIIGFNSQTKTPKAARDIYDWHFRQEALDNIINGRFPERVDRGIVDENAIDDGRSAGSRESLFMTGDQYLKYREQYGLPGRDIKNINPNELYNKQDEQDKYGFIPYLTTDRSVEEFHNASAPQTLSSAFNDLANMRRNLTDFIVDFEGEKYSGKDIMKNVSSWSSRVKDQWQDQSRLVTDKSQADEWSIPQAIEITMSDGSVEKLYGQPEGYTDPDNGQLVWVMPDGVKYRFEDMDDFKASVRYVPANDGDYVAAWQNIDPLELDDGRKIRADKVNYLMSKNNEGKLNLDDYADYGYWNKPYIVNPIEEGRWLPWLVDIALRSAPLFYGPVAGAQAGANAFSNNTGFSAGYDDYLNGTYSMLSDKPTDEQRATAVIGSAAMPLTEHLFGNLGSAAFKGPLMRLATRGGKAEGDIAPLLRWGIDATQEGLEEIPGNLVEEFQRNGIGDFYADDLYIDANGNYTTEEFDANGNKNSLAMDGQGRVMKAPTDATGRLRNFVEDIPLAFLGGSALGGTLGSLNLPGYRNEYNTRDEERKRFGDNLVIPEDIELTDEERNRIYGR